MPGRPPCWERFQWVVRFSLSGIGGRNWLQERMRILSHGAILPPRFGEERRLAMIVQRATFKAGIGRVEELAAMALAAGEQYPPQHYRVYLPHIGPFDVLSIEWEFESLAEYEKYWAEWYAKPETAAFIEKWNELSERGGSSEIWELAQ